MYPNVIKIAHQIAPPSAVYSAKSFKFIFARPAGNEIKCFTPGKNRPVKTDIAPCSAKNCSIFLISMDSGKNIFPYLQITNDQKNKRYNN